MQGNYQKGTKTIMNNSNETSGRQINRCDVQQDATQHEDEIGIMNYLFVLWKHKWLILICSVLPALIVGTCIYFFPRKYEVTYVYDANIWNLSYKKYNVLLSKFYGKDNLNKIIIELQKNKLDKFAQKIKDFDTEDQKKFATLEVVPPFPDFANLSEKDPGQLAGFKGIIGSFLKITIASESRENLSKIGIVIKNNIERTMPIYLIERDLTREINGYRSKIADIEGAGFATDLLLKGNKDILEKLKKIKSNIPDKSKSEIILQFDVGGQSEYLPLEYQIRAVEAKIVGLEVSHEVSKAKYNHYKELLSLYERLSNEIKSNVSSNYTIEQFYSFLTRLSPDFKNKEIKNHLASYMMRIKNKISENAPISENPAMFAVATGMVKISVVVFVAAFVISILISFIVEAYRKSKNQVKAAL